MISACESSSFCWPSMPISSSRMWREYRSSWSSFMRRILKQKRPWRARAFGSAGRCSAARWRSVGRLGFDLALDRGLADHHRLALQAVQCLGELEVVGRAVLEHRLRRLVGALGRFVFELL